MVQDKDKYNKQGVLKENVEQKAQAKARRGTDKNKQIGNVKVTDAEYKEYKQRITPDGAVNTQGLSPELQSREAQLLQKAAPTTTVEEIIAQTGISPEEAQQQLVEQPSEQFLSEVDVQSEAIGESELQTAFSSEFGQRISALGGQGLASGLGGFNDIAGQEYAYKTESAKALDKMLSRGAGVFADVTIADIKPDIVLDMMKSGRDVDKLKGVISQTGMISGGIEELATNNGITRANAVARMNQLDNEMAYLEQQIQLAAAENPELKLEDGYAEVITELKDQRIEVAAKTAKIVNEAGTFNPTAVQFIMDDLATELDQDRQDIMGNTVTNLQKKQTERLGTNPNLNGVV